MHRQHVLGAILLRRLWGQYLAVLISTSVSPSCHDTRAAGARPYGAQPTHALFCAYYAITSTCLSTITLGRLYGVFLLHDISTHPLQSTPWHTLELSFHIRHVDRAAWCALLFSSSSARPGHVPQQSAAFRSPAATNV
ncbi:hypothetical protein BC834DRAFT_577044 [Gloeopeniophorella convolvens]|nr:hypothetical protein BC834DRAFT_577044 [Gloeopeniophorella convolvens]